MHGIRTARYWLLVFATVVAMGKSSATTFTVTNTADSGLGSYRQALLDANATPSANQIVFNIPGGGVQTIAPLTPLPDITNPVAINGYSQPGSSANTLANSDNAVILIRLDGVNLTSGFPSGVYFNGASGSSVRGLVVVRFAYGIQLCNSSGTVVAGNWIGLDVDGIARGNTFGGVPVSCAVFTPTAGVVIGGLTPADRNVVSGNREGVTFFSSALANCAVLGNFIGTDATGTLPRGNLFSAVFIQSSVNITIGGASAGARNILSACTAAGGRGVGVLGSNGHLIQGNYIGTDVTGQLDLGNSSDGIMLQGANNIQVRGNQIVNNRANGIFIFGSNNDVIEGNLIGTDATLTRPLGNALTGITTSGSTNRVGGLSVGQANTIQFNGGAGIAVTSPSGVENQIMGNRIYDNAGLGIDLGTADVTVNDPADEDTGANQLQNFPVLTNAAVVFGALQIQGTLNSSPSASLHLEFFASPSFDPTGLIEGQLFLGSLNVNTDPNGDVAFTMNAATPPPSGYLITATATDERGNTSEFSAGLPFSPGSAQPPVLTIQSAADTATIAWPSAAATFALEASNSLSPTSQWQIVTSGIVEVGEWKNFVVTNLTGASSQFFRLKKP